MSEPNIETPATETEPPAAPQSESDEPLGEGGKKALQAERDARAAAEREKSALQKQLDEIKAAQMSDLERAQKEANDAKADAETARAEALRFRIASKHSISDEDAELFLTGTDEATLTQQAARLVERTPASSTSPKPDLSQGGTDKAPPSTTGDKFAEFFTQQLGG